MSLIKILSFKTIKEIFVVNVSSPMLEPCKKKKKKNMLVILDALYT